MSTSLPNPRVLLIGLMGTGKSTVGRAIAERTGWPYVDNDDLVQRSAGAALEQLRLAEGGDALHAHESQALLSVLALPAPWVAGAAAWAVLPESNRHAIRQAGPHVVWLRATAETLAGRLADDGSRPYLQPDPLVALQRMIDDRSERYAGLADIVIDVDAATPGELADRIVAAVGS